MKRMVTLRNLIEKVADENLDADLTLVDADSVACLEEEIIRRHLSGDSYRTIAQDLNCTVWTFV